MPQGKTTRGGVESGGRSEACTSLGSPCCLLVPLCACCTLCCSFQFRPDLTVGYVKVEVAKKHGIPFDCQELELAGKPMADPFSLSDYPALKASRANAPVRVVLKRVVPSDGEGDADEVPEAGAGAGKGEEQTSDYDDESFED